MDWFVRWYRFMREDLWLKGSELYIYAVIYGFSKQKKTFSGSLKYLEDVTGFNADYCCCSLKKLVNKGYIKKTAINARRIEYTIVPIEELELDGKNAANKANLTPKCETQSKVSNPITDENKSICDEMDAINDKPPNDAEKRLAEIRANLQKKIQTKKQNELTERSVPEIKPKGN